MGKNVTSSILFAYLHRVFLLSLLFFAFGLDLRHVDTYGEVAGLMGLIALTMIETGPCDRCAQNLTLGEVIREPAVFVIWASCPVYMLDWTVDWEWRWPFPSMYAVLIYKVVSMVYNLLSSTPSDIALVVTNVKDTDNTVTTANATASATKNTHPTYLRRSTRLRGSN